MHLSAHFIILASLGSLARAASLLSALGLGGTNSNGPNAAQTSGCTPFTSAFSSEEVTKMMYSPFIAVSPEGSYEASGDGLALFLSKPNGPVTKEGYVNSAVGQGATVNSTFLLSHGKVTYQVAAPLVAGSVTAVILIADGHDEVDVEILGSDPHHWQTNVYAPAPSDQKPLWGLFSGVENMPSGASVDQIHNYTIDFNSDRIIWSVDGKEVRTLKPDATNINGTQHYPTQAMRLQMGIWDASTPEGTSEWAGGPIDWQNAPQSIKATIKSVTVECD